MAQEIEKKYIVAVLALVIVLGALFFLTLSSAGVYDMALIGGGLTFKDGVSEEMEATYMNTIWNKQNVKIFVGQGGIPDGDFDKKQYVAPIKDAFNLALMENQVTDGSICEVQVTSISILDDGPDRYVLAGCSNIGDVEYLPYRDCNWKEIYLPRANEWATYCVNDALGRGIYGGNSNWDNLNTYYISETVDVESGCEVKKYIFNLIRTDGTNQIGDEQYEVLIGAPIWELEARRSGSFEIPQDEYLIPKDQWLSGRMKRVTDKFDYEVQRLTTSGDQPIFGYHEFDCVLDSPYLISDNINPYSYTMNIRVYGTEYVEPIPPPVVEPEPVPPVVVSGEVIDPGVNTAGIVLLIIFVFIIFLGGVLFALSKKK